MDSSDSDDDVIVSSLMLVASTLYRRRQLRVRTIAIEQFGRSIGSQSARNTAPIMAWCARSESTTRHRTVISWGWTTRLLIHCYTKCRRWSQSRHENAMRCSSWSETCYYATLLSHWWDAHTSLCLAKLNGINAFLFVLLIILAC